MQPFKSDSQQNTDDASSKGSIVSLAHDITGVA